MLLDPELCYVALKSHDSRFDGRFFTGVRTTGVYCRPICPAPLPRQRNVRFFPSAAAAELAGFRPCRRCRPELAPAAIGPGGGATVSRALRLIADGALDEGTTERLAARLRVGTRQLNRLFRDHLGATPVAVARTRRVHFARQLLDETDLSMTEVAFGAGFSSVRRFNTVIKATFGRTPTALRRSNRIRCRERDHGAELELRLSYRPPLDWPALLDYLRPRAIAGVEFVSTDAYRRTVSVNGEAGEIEVRPLAKAHTLSLRLRIPVFRGIPHVVERVRRMFDLDADPETIASCLGEDPDLKPVIDAFPGVRVAGAWDGFELSVRAILGQQVSVTAASTLAGRLAERYGEPLPHGEQEGLRVTFPTPEILASADLSKLGMPRTRSEAIRRLAQAVRDGEIEFHTPGDPDEARAQLLSLPGIGTWTAEYVAMRALREPDAFPAGDLGLRKALCRNGEIWKPAQLEKRSAAWRPWRAYAAMLLWKTLAPGWANAPSGSPSAMTPQ